MTINPPRHPSAILIGGMFGVMLTLFWPVINDFAERVTDSAWPVVEGTAEVTERLVDSVKIHIRAKKLRDCRYLRVQAYSRMPHGILRDAYAKRLDRPETGGSKPAGIYWDAGTWELWPTSGAIGLVVYAQHDCDGRQVSSLLAEVNL